MRPIVKTAYLVCEVDPVGEINVPMPESGRIFMDESEAKDFVSRNCLYEMFPLPLIEWVEE